MDTSVKRSSCIHRLVSYQSRWMRTATSNWKMARGYSHDIVNRHGSRSDTSTETMSNVGTSDVLDGMNAMERGMEHGGVDRNFEWDAGRPPIGMRYA